MPLEKFKDSRSAGETGTTLVEVLVSTLILVTGVLTMAEMFMISTTSNVSAKRTTLTTALAAQKLEQLRALTWGFDPQGLPVSDFTTDTSVEPESPNGGTGLQPSPSTALGENTAGYVDHLNVKGLHRTR